MKHATPLWIRDEEEGRGESLERLVARQDWKGIALILEDGDSIPVGALPQVEALNVAKHLLPLHLQPDGSNYWYVERFRPFRKLQIRRRAGEHKAVGQ